MGYYNISIAVLYIIALAILVTAAVIDIRKMIIPDRLIIVGLAVGLILRIFISGNGFMDGVLGGISAGSILLLIYQITKGSLGFGDVKLFGCIGIYLGLENTISAMLMAAILSGVFSLVLVCMNRNNSKREIPFAPFILAGTLVAVIFGEVI